MTREYKSTAPYMRDYKFSLLTTIINKKLGLEKRISRAAGLINGMVHDLKKTIPEHK